MKPIMILTETSLKKNAMRHKRVQVKNQKKKVHQESAVRYFQSKVDPVQIIPESCTVNRFNCANCPPVVVVSTGMANGTSLAAPVGSAAVVALVLVASLVCDE